MTKMRKIYFLMALMVAVLTISFVQAAIESTKPSPSYLTTEVVSVKSTAKPCLPPTENVTLLYIVENKDIWENGEELIDVRDNPQEIPNTQFSSKVIWSNPKAGFYDIVVDCNKNGKYDSGIEPLSLGVGFEVTAVKGTGKAAVGEKNIGDHLWMYDSEEPRLTNEMLQLSLSAEGEDIKLDNITIQASGAGNDAEIDKLEVYIDENNNGKLDNDEIMIGDSQPAYAEDNGLTTIILDSNLTQGTSQNILIIYTMKQTTPVGEYSLSVNSIYGIGESSGSLISFTGLPVNSGVKKVLPEKTCLGSLALEFTPSPATEGSIVKAKISGLTGCQNKTVVLRANPCGSSIQDKISSCILGTEGCEISFTVLTSQTYHACVNKNEDNDMIDFGEYTLEDLIVVGKPKPAVEVNVTGNVTLEINVTGEENVTGVGITGGVIEEFTKKLSGAGSLLLILEATLLLIFIVLVIIALRLKRPRTTEKSENIKK